jgi:predicted RNA methylase
MLVSLVIPAVLLGLGYSATRPEIPRDEARSPEPKPGTWSIGFKPPPNDQIETFDRVEDFPQLLARFKTVFWDPRDTESLRWLIRTTPLVKGKTVLEIGTGTGLLSLCCLQAGAAHVVATDVNPAAIANATYNAAELSLADRLETRLVPLDQTGAFTTISPTEQFDLIISNPPWENRTPGPIDEYALYDRDFALMRSLLEGLETHLKPGGKALLAYGCGDAIATLERLARDGGFEIRKLDDRDPRDLPEVFLPGMLFEVSPRVVPAASPPPDGAKLKPHPDAVPNIHAPGDVDKPELVPFIVADPAALPGIVVDETSATLVGKWQYSTHTPPYVGLGYLHDQKEGKGEKSVTFVPDLPHDGLYEVRLAHCYNIRRPTNTPVTIHHAGGDTMIRINQQEMPEHDRLFRSVGTFRFQAGRSGWVRISSEGTEGKNVIADAVQWLPLKEAARENPAQ